MASCTPETIRRYIRDGKLPAGRVTEKSTLRIREDHLLALFGLEDPLHAERRPSEDDIDERLFRKLAEIVKENRK